MSPELEVFIEQEVSSGRFADREAMLSHAVTLMKLDYEDAIAGIQAGLEDLAAGRVMPVDEAFEEIRRAVDISEKR